MRTALGLAICGVIGWMLVATTLMAMLYESLPTMWTVAKIVFALSFLYGLYVAYFWYRVYVTIIRPRREERLEAAKQAQQNTKEAMTIKLRPPTLYDCQRELHAVHIQAVRAESLQRRATLLRRAHEGGGLGAGHVLMNECEELIAEFEGLLVDSYMGECCSSALEPLVNRLRTWVLVECGADLNLELRAQLATPLKDNEEVIQEAVIHVLTHTLFALDSMQQRASTVFKAEPLSTNPERRRSRVTRVRCHFEGNLDLKPHSLLKKAIKLLREVRAVPCSLKAIDEELRWRRAQLKALRSTVPVKPPPSDATVLAAKTFVPSTPSRGAVDAELDSAPPPLMRTSSSASLPGLAEAEVSDDEEDTVARGAATSTSRVRTFRKRVSNLTGQTGFFSGKRAPEALLGGMPPAADVCPRCNERPGDLTCCACAASICARCSTLTGDALARAAQLGKKSSNSRPKKDAKTLYVCDGCGGGLSSTRCAECPLRAGNDPLDATVVVGKLKGAGHHHASLNCEEGPTFQSKSPPCTNGSECVNCFDKETGNRIDDGRPRGDATTAKDTRELLEFSVPEGFVLLERGTGRRATVMADGTGLKATVQFEDSAQPVAVTTALTFDRYLDGDDEVEIEDFRLPLLTCRLCRSDAGTRARDARHREARALMNAERADDGVRGPVRDRSTYHSWRTPNPNNLQRRCDFDRVADAYNDIVAASLPQEDDAVTGRQVCFGVQHTSRCPPVAW